MISLAPHGSGKPPAILDALLEAVASIVCKITDATFRLKPKRPCQPNKVDINENSDFRV